jgi:hypothetical protein
MYASDRTPPPRAFTALVRHARANYSRRAVDNPRDGVH